MIINTIKKLPVIILNLKRETARKNHMIEKIRKTEINNYIFLEAVDGEYELKKFNFKVIPDWKDPIDKKKINVGYIGCTLSHYLAWKYILDNKINIALILEDDTTFNSNFDSVMKQILNSEKKFDLLYLNRIPLNLLYNLGDEIEINNDFVLAKYSYNASSYLITYECAKKLLSSNILNYMLPIDEFLPIMYDNNYPFKNYSAYFNENEKIIALALKKDIADQEPRNLFPSSIQTSKIYEEKYTLVRNKSVNHISPICP
jgi:GR25 family glycosyltransferase involved in LPS biosynthesis